MITQPFLAKSRLEVKALGAPDLPLVVIPHPLGDLQPAEVRARADEAADAIVRVLVTDVAAEARADGGTATAETAAPALLIDVPGSFDEVNELFHERGWSDGLPIVPPTEANVRAMLRYTDRAPGEVIGRVPPLRAAATVEKIAINAVMAGCQPRYFPVVLAAVEAMLRPSFNMYGIQATTNPSWPLIVVNGPIATELGINGKGNVLGPGFRANSTIGRAVRLVMVNIGGGIPHAADKATQGQPGKVGLCIAENEDEHPWEPLHVARGFDRRTSTVSVVAITGTFNLLDFASESAGGILGTFARTIATPGMQNAQLGYGPVVLIGPEHAARIASEGFTRTDVQRWLYEHARVPIRAFSTDTQRAVLRRRRRKWVMSDDPDARVPVADHWEELTILVAGGPGSHSVLMPTFLGAVPVTVPIATVDGQPVGSVEALRQA